MKFVGWSEVGWITILIRRITHLTLSPSWPRSYQRCSENKTQSIVSPSVDAVDSSWIQRISPCVYSAQHTGIQTKVAVKVIATGDISLSVGPLEVPPLSKPNRAQSELNFTHHFVSAAHCASHVCYLRDTANNVIT